MELQHQIKTDYCEKFYSGLVHQMIVKVFLVLLGSVDYVRTTHVQNAMSLLEKIEISNMNVTRIL